MRLMVGIVIGGLLGLGLFQNPGLVAAVASEWPLLSSLSARPSPPALPRALPRALPERAEPERSVVEAATAAPESSASEGKVSGAPAQARVTDAAEARGFQSAWMPFRSEASASGFARQLSDQLQRPIEVVRQGPGRYQVGFHYLTEEERRAVLSSIELTTGYQVPKG